jgi:hypothetical protein
MPGLEMFWKQRPCSRNNLPTMAACLGPHGRMGLGMLNAELGHEPGLDEHFTFPLVHFDKSSAF